MDNNIKNDFEINDQYTLAINIIVIIGGLVIGLIFGYLLFNSNIYIGPNSNEIVSNIYTDSKGKKFKWIPKICICPINLSMDKLKNIEYKDSNH